MPETDLLLETVIAIPVLGALAAAVVLAIVRWRRHPRASALALAGAVILLVGFSVVSFFELLFIVELEMELDGLTALIDLLIIWVWPFAQAVGLALLVGAIFIDRIASRDPD